MINAVNLTLDVCGFIILLILLYTVNYEYKVQGHRGKIFLVILYTLFIYLIIDIFGWGLMLWVDDINNTYSNLTILGNCVEYLLAQLWMIFYFRYIITFLNERLFKNWCIISLQLLALGVGFYGAFCTVLDGNMELSEAGFVPSNYYLQYLCVDIFLYAGLIFILFRYRRLVKSSHDMAVLALYLFIPLFSSLIDGLTAIGIYTFPFCAVLSNVICLMFMHQRTIAEGAKELELQKILTTQLQVKIMLSQIKPHFLYNSLNNIVGLCDVDAELAKKATINFTKYLRGHLKALGNADLISLSDELKHIDAYLNIERIRFGEHFDVEYAIEDENIKLPPLTLQPLVENAIRHGIRYLDRRGRIILSAQETEAEYVIAVEDNGTGFDVKEIFDDDEHVGIANIRKRLKLQCEGRLELSSTIGVGSRAVIHIPKHRS